MISLAGLQARLATIAPPAARAPLAAALAAAWPALVHGDAGDWEAALAALPDASARDCDLAAPAIRIGTADDIDAPARERLYAALQQLHPWRKGPFELFGVAIDSEWRSDLKWARVQPHLAPLAGRHVLDVGCGNGYYALRMLGAGAAGVVGIDPGLRLIAQFEALHHYLPAARAVLLPLKSEQLPPALGCFDSVFSMGVIYHRREPAAHLAELHCALAPGGELVLETLVIDAAGEQVLEPRGRYAKMRNVWHIPSPGAALHWLRAAGFRAARCVDIAPTTGAEQRRSAWMRFESLADFLDPADPSRTVEGHPAPLRAVFLATR